MSEALYPVPAQWAQDALVDDARYQAMYHRSVEDPEGFWREAAQRIDVLACEIAGLAGWAEADGQSPDLLATALPRYLNGRAATIYAGSNEIQRDLIARAVLG